MWGLHYNINMGFVNGIIYIFFTASVRIFNYEHSSREGYRNGCGKFYYFFMVG